jgi:DNA-binding transcriptional regulator YdaS (Cro superfamily)
MKLAEYMKSIGLGDLAMAEKIGGCSEFAVKKWKYGERTPRPEQMVRIRAATGGQVSADDFMREPNSGATA